MEKKSLRIGKEVLKLSEKYPIQLLLGLQLVLLLIAFNKTLLHPHEYMLCNYNDGMRQYFFYQSVVEQDVELGWGKVYSMGYPYGEYVFFTDATPLIAWSLKFFSTYFYDLSGKSIYFFNLFILFGHLLSSLFLFRILMRLKIQLIYCLFFALFLPWLGIEFFKITQGHLNLSISWPLLGTIYLLGKGFDLILIEQINKRDFGKWILSTLAFLLAIGLIHLYWLAMVAFAAGVFFLGLLLFSQKERQKLMYSVFSLGIAIILPTVFLLLFIRLSDGYFDARLPHGEGYGWEHWVLQFEGLFSSHAHNSIPFVFEDSKLYYFGSFAYLGNFSLYAFLFLLIEMCVRKNIRKVWTNKFREEGNRLFLFLLFISAFFSLMISLGENIYLQRLDWTFTNYLNPFYYLHLISDRITQFRDVSRFSFIVFWVFNILLIYAFSLRLKIEEKIWIKGALPLIFLSFILVDTFDSISLARKEMNRPNLLAQGADEEIQALASQIKAGDYQAFIPIPYNHEGAGDNHYVIDGFDDFLTNTMQLQSWTGIPMMSAKFARGNFQHAQNLQSLFKGEGVSDDLLKELDNRPILIVYNSDFYNGKRELRGNSLEPAWSILQNSHKIIEKYKMQEVARKGSFILYQGNLK
ncbi:MAG: hypothetical protein AAFR87_05950 [Bacteroidota bacterium]